MDLQLDFSGVAIGLAGLSQAIADKMRTDWAAFVAAGNAQPFLRVTVVLVDEELEPAPYRPKLMRSSFGPDEARFDMPEGRAEITNDGEARIRLVQGHRAYWTLVNLLRAVLAWRLPHRGGALLHAAGLVLDDRAFLLIGSEGSGKTTWARLGEGAGARVLSDDVVLVDGDSSGIVALGSPFRSDHVAAYRPGRWPLARILFPRQGTEPALERCSPVLSRARITANMPFVSSAIEQDPRVAAVVERLACRVPCSELTFGLDAGFCELLR